MPCLFLHAFSTRQKELNDFSVEKVTRGQVEVVWKQKDEKPRHSVTRMLCGSCVEVKEVSRSSQSAALNYSHSIVQAKTLQSYQLIRAILQRVEVMWKFSIPRAEGQMLDRRVLCVEKSQRV